MQQVTLIARLLSVFLLLSIAALVIPAQAHAQEQTDQSAPKIDQRKLLVQPRNPDGSIKTPPFLSDPVLWIMIKQRTFYGAMDQSLKQLKTQSSVTAAITLMLLSFGYGVFHAAGPGHGKAVISAWLLATENELRRGILIAFMSAFIQAVTAVAIISILLLFVTAVGSTARDVAGFLESASYALVALMGIYLVWTAFRPHQHGAEKARTDHAHNHHDHHHHGHGRGHHDHAHASHAHHDHSHDHDCACGHAHVPEASQVKGEWSLTKAFSLAFAVGIRPCSGALAALIAASLIGIYWAGIASTFIMALGTAITVSVIAAIAVYSKKLATRLAERDTTWLSYMAFGLRLGGGLVIVALGGILFWGSLYSTNTMM